MMTRPTPRTEFANGCIQIVFSEGETVTTAEVTGVIDLDDFGEAVGLEVLDWHRQLSNAQLGLASPSGPLRWSYDEEIDAIYIHLREGRAQNQRSVHAVAQVDVDGLLVRLDVPIPDL